MQVVLLENIYKLGKIGDNVEVKNGYGRNYLLKTGKALRASKENLDFVNKKKDDRAHVTKAGGMHHARSAHWASSSCTPTAGHARALHLRARGVSLSS